MTNELHFIESSSPLTQFTPNDVVSPITSIAPTEDVCTQCQEYRIIIAQLRQKLYE